MKFKYSFLNFWWMKDKNVFSNTIYYITYTISVSILYSFALKNE